jgi:thioredoxin 1
MLQTNLTHIESEEQFNTMLSENDNVMVCCGRMGPMCIPVYEVMEELEDEYSQVKFADLYFDGPHGYLIRNLPECQTFNGLPFVVYFKEGKVVKATSSIQSRDQVTSVLDEHFTAQTA